jgi:hypothetical protein
MPRLEFHNESVETKGGKFHVTFEVSGGQLDTSVVNNLTDVTLERRPDGKYTLVTGGTPAERSTRNSHVYFALVQHFCANNRNPLDELIAEDQSGKKH